MNRRDAGFTLVEAIASLAVLAILVTVGLPSFARLRERQQSATVISALVTHMQLARMAAVTYRDAAIMCPSGDMAACDAAGDWSLGWIVFVDRDGDRRPDPGDRILRGHGPVPRGIVLKGTRGRQQLRYQPDGRSAGSNLTIHVCNRNGEKAGAVVVNNGGRPRIERPAPGTPCPAA